MYKGYVAQPLASIVKIFHALIRSRHNEPDEYLPTRQVDIHAVIDRVGSVTINPRHTIKQMVWAGRQAWSNKQINSTNFPITECSRVTYPLVLVRFTYDILSEHAIEEMVRMQLEPARIEHLLLFASYVAWRQNDQMTIALGSTWQDNVPCLYGSRYHSALDLAWWGELWNTDTQFLAIDKT